MKPSLKYYLFIFGIACAIFGVIIASVLGSWFNLEPQEQSSLLILTDKIIPFPLLGALILFIIIGGIVSLLFRYYIIPIMRISESTQLFTLANPSHRVPEVGAREVAHLARMINASADAYQNLQHEVEDIIYNARAELLEERNRFAALMSELPTGVLVCNIQGLILLYNRQSQILLRTADQSRFTDGEFSNGWIGLGRSLFGVIPREQIADGIKRMQQQIDAGDSDLTTRFIISLEPDHTLNISMAPVFNFHCEQHEVCRQCEKRKLSGMVLVIDDNPSNGGQTSTENNSESPQLPDTTANKQAEGAAKTSTIEGFSLINGPRPIFYEFDLFHHMESKTTENESLRRLTYVAFDTETTGLEPSMGDEIIQLGAVRIVNGKIMQGEMIDQLVDPKRPIPASSVAIHGITSEMVAHQPSIGQLLPHFHRFAEGAVLIAHNAAFDMRCLKLKEERTGVTFDNPVLDTLLLSSIIHPHQESHSIDDIAARLNLNNLGRHTALGDAIVTAEILLKMIPLLEAMGIITLNDAIRASMSSPYAHAKY